MAEEETQVEESDEKSERDGEPEGKGATEGEGQANGGGDGEERMQMDDPKVDEQIEEVENNPPQKLEDWPDGPAKYRTIGGGDANQAWEDGPTANLGPSDVRYYSDGTVTVHGEEVDNPDDYKGEPIPGGPTDPNAPDDPSGLQDQDKEEAGEDTDGDG